MNLFFQSTAAFFRSFVPVYGLLVGFLLGGMQAGASWQELTIILSALGVVRAIHIHSNRNVATHAEMIMYKHRSGTGSARERFDELFELLVGIHPAEAQTDGKGFVYVPGEIDITGPEAASTVRQLSELADDKWYNHIVGDEPAGWWIKRPQ